MAITINHQTNDLSATSGSITIDGSSVGGLTGLTNSASPYNTGLGTGSFNNATAPLPTGTNNVAVGWNSSYALTSGSSNTAVGAYSLNQVTTGSM